jgi:hypothetical protein
LKVQLSGDVPFAHAQADTPQRLVIRLRVGLDAFPDAFDLSGGFYGAEAFDQPIDRGEGITDGEGVFQPLMLLDVQVMGFETYFFSRLRFRTAAALSSKGRLETSTRQLMLARASVP